MTKGQRIKDLREKMGLTQDELAKELNTTKQTIYKYENDIVTNIPSDRIMSLALSLNASPGYIMGYAENGKAHSVKIKVLGRVAAGSPIEALEDIVGEEEIPESLAKTGTFFGLRIKGDSMTPRICEGDTVIVRKQEDAESEEIVIAMVNGCEATCKRLMKYDNGISLISFNPAYPPMFFTNDEIVSKPVQIIGRVVQNIQRY